MTAASRNPMIIPDVPPSQWPMSINRPVKTASSTAVLSVLKITVFPYVSIPVFWVSIMALPPR
jgi:hypothetical protein